MKKLVEEEGLLVSDFLSIESHLPLDTIPRIERFNKKCQIIIKKIVDDDKNNEAMTLRKIMEKEAKKGFKLFPFAKCFSVYASKHMSNLYPM